MNNYTLHIRLLKSCNAVCGYCSAFEVKHDRLMSDSQLEASLEFIKKKIFLLRQKEYQKRHCQSPGSVWILDKKSKPHLQDEINLAHRNNYSLVVRPLFTGGLDDCIKAGDMAKIRSWLSFIEINQK